MLMIVIRTRWHHYTKKGDINKATSSTRLPNEYFVNTSVLELYVTKYC